MEPAYPGVRGHYINLGECYDRRALFPLAEEFIGRKTAYQAAYARAYQCLRAAHEVRRSGESELLTAALEEKLARRAKGILSRELRRKRGEPGEERRAFLGAISAQGVVVLHGTIHSRCKRVYELQDYAGLSHHLLARLREGILAAGYELQSFLSPEDPKRLTELVVPELSLAFVATQARKPWDYRPYRRVRLETLVERELVKQKRPRLRFSGRIADSLLEDGVRELALAKSLHDELEVAYHPYVNFALADEITETLIKEITALP